MRPEALAPAAATTVAIVSSLAIPLPALARQWPDKPVRMLVPFPPGGGTDIQARLLSNAFQKSMGQNFIVDNRTGAGGLIATQLTTGSRWMAARYCSRPKREIEKYAKGIRVANIRLE